MSSLLPCALVAASLLVNRGVTATVSLPHTDSPTTFTQLSDLKLKRIERIALRVYKVYLQDDTQIVFTCVRSDIWKVVVLNRSTDVVERQSWAVEDVQQILNSHRASVQVEEDENYVRLTPILNNLKDQKSVQIRINKLKFSIDFIDASTGRIFQSNWSFSIGTHSVDSTLQFSFNKENHVYGLGEKSGLNVDKKGQRYVMWNYDHFGYAEDGDPLYQSIPFVILANPPTLSDNTDQQQFHSVFIDNVGRQQWDLTSEDKISVECNADPCRFYVSLANDFAGLVSNYVLLTGKSPLPPLHAFGYQQCRWSYENEQRVKQVTSTLREKDIPCDIIYLDIDYMDRFKCFTWGNSRFPDPQKLVEWLQERNYRTVVIIDPGIKIESDYDVYESGVKGDYFVKRYEKDSLVNYVNKCWAEESYFPDFTVQKTRQWWGTHYKKLTDIGIKSFWNDMNEPACFNTQAGIEKKTFHSDVIHNCDGEETTHDKCHNIYGMQMARASYEGLSKLLENERPFVVTRSGYAGIQRYAWTWTGDNTSNFAHLAMSIPMLLNMGLTGQPFTGADVGGFCNNCEPELYARWISFASIAYPFCRSHTTQSTIDQEPYSFGDRVEEISRTYIQLRYRLMPYFYTWARHSCITGQPILRSLFYMYPTVSKCYEAEFASTQLFVGPDLLVCPVVTSNATTRTLYLPPGTWYSFYDRKEYSGDKVITVDAPWETVPLFVRENSQIPMRKIHRDSVYLNLLEPLVIEFFGKNREEARVGQVYLDDGISLNYQRGEYGLYEIRPDSSLHLVEGKGGL